MEPSASQALPHREMLPPDSTTGLDPDTTEGAIDLAFAVPNLHVEYVAGGTAGHSDGFWRSVGPRTIVFVVESFMMSWRRRRSRPGRLSAGSPRQRAPRAKAVLDPLRRKPLGKTLAQRVGRGVSSSTPSRLYGPGCRWRCRRTERFVRRVVCASICGTVVNPDTVRAQIQSGIVFGLTAALRGEITLKGGRVEQSNFHDYQMLRMTRPGRRGLHRGERRGRLEDGRDRNLGGPRR